MRYLGFVEKFLGQDRYIRTCLIIKKYNFNISSKVEKNILVSSSNFSGLADRLRGMISVYALSKATGKRFFIEHDEPFRLSDYYTSNEYDWIDHEGQISHSLFYTSPLVMTDNSSIDLLNKVEVGSKHQYHIYTNINLIPFVNEKYKKQYTYHKLFKELFKPSEKLRNACAKYDKQLSAGFFSISFRFLQLMGDFKDGIGDTLDEQQQIELLKKCRDFVCKLHKQHEDIPYVLVTSDSQKFIDYIADIEWVFVIEGKIGHINFVKNDNVYLKTFMDFYMISQAKFAYMAYTGNMYRSKFSASAAMTTGIQFKEIEF